MVTKMDFKIKYAMKKFKKQTNHEGDKRCGIEKDIVEKIDVQRGIYYVFYSYSFCMKN